MKELKLRQGAQGPLKEEVSIFCSCFTETLCNNVSCPRTGHSLGPEFMITQHNVLLMEMFFLSSMLMICSCNKSCLGTCFSRLAPLIHSNSVSCPETLPGKFSLANLVQNLSQDVCLGKGSAGTLINLRYSFNLFCCCCC